MFIAVKHRNRMIDMMRISFNLFFMVVLYRKFIHIEPLLMINVKQLGKMFHVEQISLLIYCNNYMLW